MAKVGPDLPRPSMPPLRKGKIDLTKPPKKPAPNEIHDPYGVLAKFLADKDRAKQEAAQRAADELAKKREHYREKGELLPEEQPEDPPQKGGRGRKSKPATLWICNREGEIRVEECPKTGAAHDQGKALALHHNTRWVRVFNDSGGRVYFGPAWVHSWDIGPGEPKPVNMVNSVWLSLTPYERHLVKEKEIPKYVKPGEICTAPRKELPSQKAKTSRKGQTWDRMRRSQGWRG